MLYEGPSEEVMQEVLQVFHDVFEYAAETDWMFENQHEFYRLFTFEDQTTKEAVIAFNPILSGCPTLVRVSNQGQGIQSIWQKQRE